MPKPTTSAVRTTTLLPAWILRRHERHYRDSYFHLWADIILALLLAGLITTVVWLFLWQPQADFTLAARVLSSRVASGQMQEFNIHYSNDEGHPIGAVEMELELPEYFILDSVEGAASFDKERNVVSLGDLPAKAEGKVVVRGIVRGEVGSQQSLGMNLTYQHDSIRKQVLNALPFTIDDSALAIVFEAPEKAYTKVPLNMSMTLKNTSDQDMKQVEIVFPSSDWNVNGNDAIANGRLVIETLAAGTEQAIEFTAAPQSDGDHDFSIEALWTIDGKPLKQGSVAHRVSVVGPGLAVTASVRENALESMSPTATLDLELRNTTDQPITNIAFTVLGNSSFSVGRIDSTDPKLNITGTTAAYADAVNPGETRRLSLTAGLQREAVVTNQLAAINVKVQYLTGTEKTEYSLATERVKLNSNLSLESAGYYYGPQGDQLGVGPIPPKVDIPTTYWIIWQVNNLGNDIENPEVTADLPANVVWSEQQSSTSGEMTYSPVTKRILWRPGSVNKTGGNYRISFPVTIVPRVSEIGTIPKLVTNIRVAGKDVFTGAMLTKSAPDITTAIEADRQSAGKGTVEPLQ